MTPDGIMDEVKELLAKYEERFKISFGLEYSGIIDWCADLTPRRGHKQARCYGEVWYGTGPTMEVAIRKAIDMMKKELEDHDQ